VVIATDSMVTKFQ